MRVATISPIPLLQWSKTSDIHLILPELCGQPLYDEYIQEMQQRGHYIILDNGAAEGKPAEWERLVELASKYCPDEVVVPDVMLDAVTTTEMAQAFQPYAARIKEAWPLTRFAAVVQGRVIKDWLASISIYANLKKCQYIDALHFPRCMNWDFPRARVSFLEGLFRYEWIDNSLYDFHCLGASSWAREVVALSELPRVRSIDTSKPIVFGLAEKFIRVSGDDVPRQDNYFQLSASPTQMEYIDDNVFTYYEWAQFGGIADPTSFGELC